MIWASADAVAANPSDGFSDGESIRIFTASARGAERTPAPFPAALATVDRAALLVVLARAGIATFKRELLS